MDLERFFFILFFYNLIKFYRDILKLKLAVDIIKTVYINCVSSSLANTTGSKETLRKH